MAKIKLTKGELKKQRDSLKQFKRYLPTLLLKKQQLQSKILEVRKHMNDRLRVLGETEKNIRAWISLLGDTSVDIMEWLKPIEILTGTTNIAGANVPVFDKIVFDEPNYDLFSTAFWVDQGHIELRLFIELNAEVEIIKQQIKILEKELRTTTQRVNLFEKIKIPECQHNIRIINIYLGDQQANAVGIGKVAKKKVEAKNLEAANA